MITGIKKTNVPIIARKLVFKELPKNKKEMIKAATANAIPTP